MGIVCMLMMRARAMVRRVAVYRRLALSMMRRRPWSARERERDDFIWYEPLVYDLCREPIPEPLSSQALVQAQLAPFQRAWEQHSLADTDLIDERPKRIPFVLHEVVANLLHRGGRIELEIHLMLYGEQNASLGGFRLAQRVGRDIEHQPIMP